MLLAYRVQGQECGGGVLPHRVQGPVPLSHPDGLAWVRHDCDIYTGVTYTQVLPIHGCYLYTGVTYIYRCYLHTGVTCTRVLPVHRCYLYTGVTYT